MPIVTIGNNAGDTFSGTEDIELIQSLPDTAAESFDPNNVEIKKFTPGDYQNGLFRFTGLSSIPAAAIITSATISLYVNASDGGGANHTFTARLGLRAWTEAGGTFNKYDGTNAWGTAGCNNATDRSSTTSGTGSFPSGAGYYVISGTQLTTDVQGIVGGSVTNNGWCIERTDGADDSTYRVVTSRNGTTGQRPFLTVNYYLRLPPQMLITQPALRRSTYF